MKYKLIKSFPGSPEVGTIFTGGNGFSYKGRSNTGHPFLASSFSEKQVESSPEFFAPYLFTTEDGVDVYVYDNFYYIGSVKNICQRECLFEGDGDFSKSKTFSTREVAQKWIEEQNRPKFEVGEWLYYVYGNAFSGYATLMRFSHFDEKYKNTCGTESYTVNLKNNKVIFEGTEDATGATVQKATPEQIQDVLSKVAKHKGFKKGVKFKSVMSGGTYSVSEFQEFKYHSYNDVLLEGWGWCVYKDGKWAEIVDEKTIPEYAELVGNLGSGKIGIASTEEFITNKNRIYDTSTPFPHMFGFINEGDSWKKVWEMYHFNFKPSTKEAYDAQQLAQLKKEQQNYVTKVKQLTVTVEGEVTGVTSEANQVKINYQTK